VKPDVIIKHVIVNISIRGILQWWSVQTHI